MSYINNSNSHLLVICETSDKKANQKDLLVQSFKKFEQRFGVDCSAIIREIEKHGLYMTNGQYYFKYNAKLSFLREFRSKREDVLKLLDFYKTFDMKRTSFWTITRKTLSLDKIIFKQSRNKTKIEFEEINQAENNLRSLFIRLKSYGYIIEKYILVVEIKENNGLFNYHFHAIIQSKANIQKIRSNKKERFRDLVYNPNLKYDLSNGWLNYPTLSLMWKEITGDDSYRIKREPIRKKLGVFHYVLSYMNKGIQYQNVEAVPYLYYAMKSKKSYRIKGLKKMPKIKYKVLDQEKNPIIFDPNTTNWIEKTDIPIEQQEYILQLYKNGYLIEEKRIIQYFKDLEKKVYKGNYLLSNFDKKIIQNRLVFTKKYNWEEVERKFSEEELQKLLTEGYIFQTREGYMLL